jgi:hypothetical protein
VREDNKSCVVSCVSDDGAWEFGSFWTPCDTHRIEALGGQGNVLA